MVAVAVAVGCPAMSFAQSETAASTGDDAARSRARLHLQQGRAFFMAGNFEGAAVEFEAAYRIRPHPTVLFNIAQCYERLFRYAAARDAYERFLRTAAADEPDRAAATERIAALDTVLSVVVIRTNVRRAQVWIDGRLEGVAPGRVRVEAGRHRIELRAPGYLPEATQVDLAGSREQEITLRMSRNEGGGVHPALFVTAAGVAVVAAGVGAGLGVHALDLSDEYERNPARTREQQSEGDTIAAVADVLFVSAGVLALTAGVLAFVTDWGGGADDGESPAPVSTRPRVVPWLSGDAAGVSIGGVLP